MSSRWIGKALADFTKKEALSCAFAFSVIAALLATRYLSVPGIARYDLLLLICLGVQVMLWKLGWETTEELKLTAWFHVLGLILEIFKTSHGSWSYPNPGVLSIAGVPLFSGFMYSSVASYITQAWRRLKLSYQNPPSTRLCWGFAVLIYLNFFTLHYMIDLRWILMAAILVVYLRTVMSFEVAERRLAMPLPLAFALIGFFIFIAENLATALGAWAYPYQIAAWSPVHVAKISSWSLLVIVSFTVVSEALGRKKPGRPEDAPAEVTT